MRRKLIEADAIERLAEKLESSPHRLEQTVG